MFWPFGKKKDAQVAQQTDDAGEDSGEENKQAVSGSVEADLTKIKSSLEALNEVRKANAEQFTRFSEQIGELRAAIMDSNKAISGIEVASTRAIDMVNSVQPDKLMIEVRKEDGKVEALRASIEANETIMKDIMREMKDMRAQMNFYKGVDQVVKMNNEIKLELVEIKKTEGLVSKHADRVETIFVEVEKKFYDFEKFNEAVKELDRTFKRMTTDFDKMRVSVEEKADKKDFVKMVDKFSDFEKHTSNILKLLDQRSKTTITELNASFDKMKEQLEKKYDKKIDVKPIAVEEAQKPEAPKSDAGAPAPSPATSEASTPTASTPPTTAPATPDSGASPPSEAKPADAAASNSTASSPVDKIKGLFSFKKS